MSVLHWPGYRELFVGMVREEWRMNAREFGPVRFAAFPLVGALVSLFSVWGLVAFGVDGSRIVAGMHALVLVFGVQTGLVGLIGGDAVGKRRDDVTLVLSAPRTLPYSSFAVLSVYFLKDVVYYSAHFLVPFSVAVLPAAPPGADTLGLVALLWVSVAGTFLLGAGVAMAGIGAWSRGPVGRSAAVVAMLGLVGAWWLLGTDPVSLSPYAWFRSPSIGTAVGGFLPGAVLFVLGAAVYDLDGDRRDRIAEGKLRRIAAAVPCDRGPLVAKTLLDQSRTTGGTGKLVFSGGILAGTGLVMLVAVERVLGTSPSPAIVLGAVLGLSAFTTFNWLTVFDEPADYLTLPVDADDVVRAKFHAFLIAGLPLGSGAYGLAVVPFGVATGPAAVGGWLVVALHLFVFGLTVRLTGLSPDERLFDGVVFAAFSVGVVVALVPVLTVGLVVEQPGPSTLAGVALWGVGAAAAGLYLFETTSLRTPDA